MTTSTVVRVPIASIAFDAGTQIRAAIDSQVVTDYAEAMTNGATFPPIILFHDGNQHYLADGFHRFMAAQRNEWREIDADVRAGTKEDALWFALGANRTNGKRLTDTDKRSAARIAIAMWPERSAAIIAEQIGCSQSLVSLVRSEMKPEPSNPVTSHVLGKDGKRYPASPKVALTKREDAARMLKGGVPHEDVRAATGLGRDAMNELRRSLGLSVDKTKAGVRQRRERMRQMATDGYTSRQIASELGLNEESCRDIMRAEGIAAHADKAVGRIKRHDSNRIIDHIVMDAENLTEGVNLIDFGDIDRERLAGWLKSLTASRDKFGAFIRRLMKEQQKNGEAA